jgi:hypothetical protein
MRSYAIYKNPSDYPDKFVVRGWTSENFELTPDADPMIVTDTLEEARTVIPIHCIGFPPHKKDDPCIVETWI